MECHAMHVQELKQYHADYNLYLNCFSSIQPWCHNIHDTITLNITTSITAFFSQYIIEVDFLLIAQFLEISFYVVNFFIGFCSFCYYLTRIFAP